MRQIEDTATSRSVFHAVGTGSFSGEDITLGSLRAIEESDYIFAPESSGRNYALDSLKAVMDEKELPEIVELPFKMGRMDEEENRSIAEIINSHLEGGRKGTFITIGDPSVCSTLYNFREYLSEDIDIRVHPGISTPFSAASLMRVPLLLKGERLLFMDEYPEREALKTADTVAVIKNRKRSPEKEKFLQELSDEGFSFWLIKRIGLPEETVIEDMEEILEDSDYMAMILGRRMKGEDHDSR